MRIGIDARAAAEVKAGRGRVVREVLEALARLEDRHEYVLYCRRPATELKLDERFTWHPLSLPDPLWHLRAARAASRDTDVFLSTNSYLSVWFTSVPAVPIVYDMVSFVPGASGQRRAAAIERATIARAMKRAKRVICISEATRRDLVARFPRHAGKCVVVPLAAGSRFSRPHTPEEREAVRRRYGLDKPFVLSTGTLEPRKNLPRLIEAFASLPEQIAEQHELVLVGPEGWEMEETLRRARARRERVKLLGYVPDEDLAVLYQLCTVFCYASLYEGFGLPLLEALQAGAPSITSNVSSLPEVGGDAARYVDPLDTGALREALSELLTSEAERDELRRRAAAQAAGFSWDRTARELLDHLVETAR